MNKAMVRRALDIIANDPRLREDFDGIIKGSDLNDGLEFLYDYGQSPGDVIVAWLRKNGEAKDEIRSRSLLHR